MKGTPTFILALVSFLLLPHEALAWNATGHQLVARIAWDEMTPAARRNVIALLQHAPQDACLLDLFPNDARPLEERQREFFMRASTWADVVRPGEGDTRACTRFHHGSWHYVNFFWEGTSGSTTDAPRNREDLQPAEANIVERLKILRPFVVCSTPPCGTTQEERATSFAWLLHLVGDLQQPLHSSSHVTARPDEREGDRGGGLFRLGPSNDSLTLHGFWDGIVDRSIPQQQGESHGEYLDRVAAKIVSDHPRSQLSSRLEPGNFEAWSREGFETTKREVYPASLQRGQLPSEEYRARAFALSEEAIAMGGYRLADLLNQMFGS